MLNDPFLRRACPGRRLPGRRHAAAKARVPCRATRASSVWNRAADALDADMPVSEAGLPRFFFYRVARADPAARPAPALRHAGDGRAALPPGAMPPAWSAARASRHAGDRARRFPSTCFARPARLARRGRRARHGVPAARRARGGRIAGSSRPRGAAEAGGCGPAAAPRAPIGETAAGAKSRRDAAACRFDAARPAAAASSPGRPRPAGRRPRGGGPGPEPRPAAASRPPIPRPVRG